MQDNNIIQEAIDCLKRLHKENAELKAYKDVNEDFKKAWEELKAENERQKDLYTDLLKIVEPYLSDFTGYDEKEQAFNIVLAVKELLLEFNTENETLKSQLDFEVQKKEVLEAKNERLTSCLQEIKEIAEKECKDCLNKRTDSCWICPYYPILDLITKAESEEV